MSLEHLVGKTGSVAEQSIMGVSDEDSDDQNTSRNVDRKAIVHPLGRPRHDFHG